MKRFLIEMIMLPVWLIFMPLVRLQNILVGLQNKIINCIYDWYLEQIKESGE